MRTLIVIPARLNSTRLPRKLLLAETGKPLIQHAVEIADSLVGDGWLRPLVAFDSKDDPFSEVKLSVKCASVATGQHPNGTSRAAEAAAIADVAPDIIVILQADEPELDPAHIRKLVTELEQHAEWDCATLETELAYDEEENRNRVKVQAFYDVAVDFSREPVAYWYHLLHIGVYAYRAAALQRYAAAGPCEREVSESLEQLRALHIGLRMGVVFVDHHGHGIDTREDYDAFVKRYKAAHENR